MNRFIKWAFKFCVTCKAKSYQEKDLENNLLSIIFDFHSNTATLFMNKVSAISRISSNKFSIKNDRSIEFTIFPSEHPVLWKIVLSSLKIFRNIRVQKQKRHQCIQHSLFFERIVRDYNTQVSLNLFRSIV